MEFSAGEYKAVEAEGGFPVFVSVYCDDRHVCTVKEGELLDLAYVISRSISATEQILKREL
jgi:hypothetical protein